LLVPVGSYPSLYPSHVWQSMNQRGLEQWETGAVEIIWTLLIRRIILLLLVPVGSCPSVLPFPHSTVHASARPWAVRDWSGWNYLGPTHKKNYTIAAGTCWNLYLEPLAHAFDCSRIGEVVQGDTYCPTITLSNYGQASSHQFSCGGGYCCCWYLNLGHRIRESDSSRIGEVVQGDTYCPTITLSNYGQASSHQSSW